MRAGKKLTPVSRQSTSSYIADQIRNLIMDGTFPPERQLGEAELAAALNVSRGPVREALQRLTQEGLVENYRNKGAFVISIAVEDIRDIYLARRAIERAAIEIVMQAKDDEGAKPKRTDLVEALHALTAKMQDAARLSRWTTLAQLDLQFHTLVVESSASRRLTRMFRTLAAETQMCLNGLEPAYPDATKIVDEHNALIKVLSGDDVAAAIQLSDKHLEDAVTSLQLPRAREASA